MKIKPCDNRTVLNPCSLENLNYQVDPYIGCEHYCYYCYALNQTETDWRAEILYHEDIVGRLTSELAQIPPQTIYMGWHTDPYQPCEAQHRQTRQVLELLAEMGFSASILTKSDLVLRDMDLLKSMTHASVSVSVAFVDNGVRRKFEAKTKDTGARIDALQQLKAAGVETAALLCPVIPYVTDVDPLIDALAEHAERIWVYGLSILDRSERSWRNVEPILDNHFPQLKPQVEAAVFSKNHVYWEDLRQALSELKTDRKLDLRIHV